MFKFMIRAALLLGVWGGISQISFSQTTENLKIGIIGDSTVCLYPDTTNQRGWGQMLPEFFNPSTTFINTAQGGRSTKTFPADRWQQVLKAKPDFIFIQFGHNDNHGKDKPESTDAATDYKEYLRRYIKESRENGSTPILVTPPHRRIFDANKKMTMELAPYANAMKEVATELSVPLIDLFAKSGELFEKLGDEGSKDFTMNEGPNPDQPNKKDLTHFTKFGATEIAKIVAQSAAEIDPKLKAAMKN